MSLDWKRMEGQVVNGALPLVRLLGSSDHSAVFLTERVGGAPQKAALKLIAAGKDADQQLARWKQSAKLAHPALIRLYESGRVELGGASLLYVVMELAEENLSQVVPERALTAEEAQIMLPPVLKALSYLHGSGLVHGSMKPSNILATGDQVKISSDTLRLAEEFTRKRSLTVYDAPEMGKGMTTPAADAWSLGVTLVEVLTQRLPGAGEKVSEFAAACPKPFDAIARGCTETDPAQRWTVAQAAARLQPEHAALKEAVANGTTTSGATTRANLPVFLGLAGIIAVVVVALFLALRGGSTDANPPVRHEEDHAPAVSAPAETAPAPKREPKPSPASSRAASKLPGDVTKGAVAQRVMPRVASSARETIEGKIRVRVRLDVDANGKVRTARLESAGPSKYFARLALEAARQWTFTPSQVQGRAVESEWRLSFGFRRTDTEVVPEQIAP